MGALGVVVDTLVESVLCDAGLLAAVGRARLNVVFSGMQPLLELHTALRRRLTAPAALAKAFDRATVARLGAVHARYSASVRASLDALRACRKRCRAFAAVTAAVERRTAGAQTLEDLYLLPLARAGAYPAFLARAASGAVPGVPIADRAHLARVRAALLAPAARADAALEALRLRDVLALIAGWDGSGGGDSDMGGSDCESGCPPPSTTPTRRFVARFLATAVSPSTGSCELYFFSDVLVHARRRSGGRKPAQFVRAFSLPVLTLRALNDDDEGSNDGDENSAASGVHLHSHGHAQEAAYLLECIDFATGARAVFGFATAARRRAVLACAEAALAELDRNEVFGVALPALMRGDAQRGRAVPAVLADTAHALRTQHAAQEGLFRISASKRALDELRRRIDRGDAPDYAALPAHTVAGLLKLWLRALPDPLCTAARRADFQAAVPARAAPSMRAVSDDESESSGADAVDPQQCVARLRAIVQTLPALNQRCLHVLFEMLACVAAHADENRMDAANLSVVFTPLLLRDGTDAETAVAAAMDGAPSAAAALRAVAAMNFECVAFMITHCDDIFRGLDALADDAPDVPPAPLDLEPLTPEEARALDAQFPALAAVKAQSQ